MTAPEQEGKKEKRKERKEEKRKKKKRKSNTWTHLSAKSLQQTPEFPDSSRPARLHNGRLVFTIASLGLFTNIYSTNQLEQF